MTDSHHSELSAVLNKVRRRWMAAVSLRASARLGVGVGLMVLAAVGAALLLRLAYLLQSRSRPFFDAPDEGDSVGVDGSGFEEGRGGHASAGGATGADPAHPAPAGRGHQQ